MALYEGVFVCEPLSLEEVNLCLFVGFVSVLCVNRVFIVVTVGVVSFVVVLFLVRRFCLFVLCPCVCFCVHLCYSQT